MLVIVNDRQNVRGVRHEFLYVQISIILKSRSQGESLVRISH